MKRNDSRAQEATGQNALVVQGYFEQLKKENEDYFKPSPEQQAIFDARRERIRAEEEARRNAMTPAERDREDKARQRELNKLMKRKGPRPRRLPTGIGTNAGLAAGDRVQLRREVK